MKKMLLVLILAMLCGQSYATTTTDTISYGTSTNMTLTLGGLGNSTTAGRTSTAVDNTVNNFTDAIVTMSIKSGATAPANDKAVYVYLYGSEDGTNYEMDGAGIPATDGNYTIDSPTNLRLATVLNIAAVNTTYTKDFTVANAFGGVMPRKWGVVVVNYSGGALNATESNHIRTYTGIKYQNQ